MPYDIVDETTAADGTPFRVILEIDEDPMDPREHGDAFLAVIHTAQGSGWDAGPREAKVPGLDYAMEHYSFQAAARWLRMFHGATVVLPLSWTGSRYQPMGLHTGYVDDTDGPGDYAGVVFDTPETRTLIEPVEHVTEAALTEEVDEWSKYARGEVFGYVVQRGELDEDGDVLESSYADTDELDDSLWGLVGEEYAQQEARNALANAVDAYNMDIAQDAERTAEDEEEVTSLRRTEVGMVGA